MFVLKQFKHVVLILALALEYFAGWQRVTGKEEFSIPEHACMCHFTVRNEASFPTWMLFESFQGACSSS